jgi:hypothetical protein
MEVIDLTADDGDVIDLTGSTSQDGGAAMRRNNPTAGAGRRSGRGRHDFGAEALSVVAVVAAALIVWRTGEHSGTGAGAAAPPLSGKGPTETARAAPGPAPAPALESGGKAAKSASLAWWASKPEEAAPVAAYATYTSAGPPSVRSGPYTLRFSEGTALNGGGKYALGVLGEAKAVDASLLQRAAWWAQTKRGAPQPRRFAYELQPTGAADNCGGVLVVTCSAPKQHFAVSEPRPCFYELAFATTEACLAPEAPEAAPQPAPTVEAAAAAEPDNKKADEVGASDQSSSYIALCVVLGSSIAASRQQLRAGWRSFGAAVRRAAREPATRRLWPPAQDCPVCMEPIAGASAACAAAGHRVCAGCLQNQTRGLLRDLAAVNDTTQLPPHFMDCPLCPARAAPPMRSARATLSFADVRVALQRAGNTLGSLELASLEAMRAEASAVRAVQTAVTRLESRAASADVVASLAAQLQEAMRSVGCPHCRFRHMGFSDACMHAYCDACNGQRFCGYCFEADCQAESCALNPIAPSYMNPGISIKLLAFTIARCRKVGQLLGGYDADAAEAALRAPEVQREVRVLLGESYFGVVNLQAVRNGSWSLRAGSPLARYATDRVRASLVAAYQARTARAGDAAATGRAANERALDAALEAQGKASRTAQAAQRQMNEARRAHAAELARRRAALTAQLAEVQDELRAIPVTAVQL